MLRSADHYIKKTLYAEERKTLKKLSRYNLAEIDILKVSKDIPLDLNLVSEFSDILDFNVIISRLIIGNYDIITVLDHMKLIISKNLYFNGCECMGYITKLPSLKMQEFVKDYVPCGAQKIRELILQERKATSYSCF